MDVHKSEMTRKTDSDKAREVDNANEYYITHRIYVGRFTRMVQTLFDVCQRPIAAKKLASKQTGES